MQPTTEVRVLLYGSHRLVGPKVSAFLGFVCDWFGEEGAAGLALGGHRAHARLLNRCPDCASVGRVGLVRLHKRSNEFRVQQQHLVAKRLDLARPPVSASACLERDHAGRSRWMPLPSAWAEGAPNFQPLGPNSGLGPQKCLEFCPGQAGEAAPRSR